MRDSDELSLVDKTRLDNQFRFAVSLSALSVACVLRSLGYLGSLYLLIWVLGIYTLPYALSWLWLSRGRTHPILRYGLGMADVAAITAVVVLTGGPESPFFYLYPIPFLVHAFHFDLAMIAWDGALSICSYGGVLWSLRHAAPGKHLELGIGQLVFLAVLLAAAVVTARRFRRKDASVERSLNALRTTVRFLEAINTLPPAISSLELQGKLIELLKEILKPFQIHPRLWILNTAWKALHGVGEHPALRPGSLAYLPIHGCPAFAMRRAFTYSSSQGDPCPSERFNYAKHRCVPIVNEQDCFGVLFLGTYLETPWNAEELQLFEMLAQSIALTLQRKILFDKLEEKIMELHFSFEVGAAALATFGGSTQSLEETTVHLLDGVLSILKVDRASLMLWDPENECLRTQWVRGGDFTVQSPLTLRLGEGMAGWALKTGEPYWAEYAMGDPHYVASAQTIRSLLCVPAYTLDRQPLGVINAVTTEVARAFQPREINFLSSFGRQAALAIENARLHQRSRADIDQLSEVNKLKSQFLSLVSHDLRGPLTGIQGFCEVLRQESAGRLSPGQRDVLEQVERQVELQERMVDDLLDLARMEKGQLNIQPAPMDLASLLQEEVEKSQLEARERRITLTPSIALPSRAAIVEADAGRIRQVVWNLIHNALKFTPEDGRVVVRARPDADGVLVEVEDTGVGLAADTQERIFDKFFQISPGGSKGSQGLGLGLAICKEIILAHHGKIRAQSPGLGLGTTISFTLPLLKAQPEDHADPMAA
jgi:signal transduction histidine kinase